MNKLFNHIIVISVFLLAVETVPVAAKPELKGLAVLETLQHPIYYAATSGLPPASPTEFEKKPMPFVMHARYIIDKISARRNSQLWLNALLVSSGREEIKKMEQAVLIFRSIVRNEMHKGDELTFEIQPDAMTVMRINGTELAQVKSQEFQYALVKYWFSGRITSKQFAQDIRQAPSVKAIAEYMSLTPNSRSNARTVAIRNALTSLLSASQTQVKTKVAMKQTSSDTKAVSKKQAPKSTKVAKRDKSQSQNFEKNTPKKKSSPKTSATRIANNKPVTKKKSNIDKTGASANKSISKNQSAKIVNAKNAAATGINDSLFTQLFDSLRDDYVSEVIEYVQLNAKPTPSRKVRKTPKDDAKLKVRLRFSGERMQVESVELVEGDFNELLVESLKKSVADLKKIPVAPEAIRSESFALNITLNFAKCKRSTSAWICF